MSPIPNFIGILVFTIIQFIIFLFVVVATPLPQFRTKAKPHTCTTLWGVTKKCNGSKYRWKGTAAFGCGRRTSTMHCGAAFAIISIAFTLVALILGLLMVAKIRCPVFVPLIFTVLSVITILISWACVAGVMTEKMCGGKINGTKVGGSKLSTLNHYGAGFGLMVTAWCLEVVDFVLLVILACL